MPGNIEDLPVILGRKPSDAMKSPKFMKVSPASSGPHFCKTQSLETQDGTLLKEILTDALVSPVTPVDKATPKVSASSAVNFSKSRSLSQDGDILLTDALVSPVPPADKAAPKEKPVSSIQTRRDPQVKHITSSTGPCAKPEESEHIDQMPRSHSGPLNRLRIEETLENCKKSGALRKPEGPRVPKRYRAHRARLQVPVCGDQLEAVIEEEASKTVMFCESPTSESDANMRRDLMRKSTPFVKKEDLPDELLAESDTECDLEDRPSAKVERSASVEFDVPEVPEDQARPNRFAERKLTGYAKKADILDASDSDSEHEMCDASDSDSEPDSEPEDEDVSGRSSPASKVVVVAPTMEKPAHGAFKHRRGTSFILDAEPAAVVEV
eukprot:gnl/MRDRNA2_/MRDRNA2_85242_c0_seq1.p1 gnl/MRDRNA2_/MRDRNA2_85242_c0~~gnl/MRDRNA2_/MRDRNA2_85242_c0_seq1.p1  ORF type:complete len:449 (+),score=91.70 gnl/MRDRNA2_/MRDRNA2_85242_c0_seq1:204-1349(+)